MNVTAFINLVWQNAKADGTPYLRLDQREELRELVGRNLNVYAEKTEALESDSVVFTPIVGRATYDTSQTSLPINGIATTYLSQPMCMVRMVILAGTPLIIAGDPQGRAGMSSEYTVSQLQNQSQAYQGAANGKPSWAWMQPPNNLRFNCPFDQVYANSWLSGVLYHTPLTGQDDGQTIDFGPADIAPAVRLCASELLMVYSKDAGLKLRQTCEAEMKQRAAAAGVKNMGQSQRRSSEYRRTLDLSH